VAEVPFHNSVVGNYMVYQNRIETNMFAAFAHPQNSEWFSIISVIIFEVNTVPEQRQA